ncbi:hypothetical protein [Lysinibacillus sphaericus]|uniref:Uncharacterized protein n=1 Tax=Lysinibacillus sphaericus TaxID=1421 RepID=A0A6H0A0K8_LYSSH|nr:hypothetical protein [Lysinibacillus sphaericus]QIS31204.1 hypothetical protein [Lysinibacillus sphaericus]QPA61248.1 hypothetical protein INQ55_23215 [Lysinibacillus sphaericus]
MKNLKLIGILVVLLGFILASFMFIKRWLYIKKCNSLIDGSVKYGYDMCHMVLEGESPTNWIAIFGGMLLLTMISGLIIFALWLPFGVTQTVREVRHYMKRK